MSLTRECVARGREDLLPQLGIALRNSALCSMRLGENDAALGPATGSIELLRGAASRDPANYDAELASALATQSSAYARRTDAISALAAQEEAVVIARQLLASDPVRYKSTLAGRLRVLATRFRAAGHEQPAAQAGAEATALAND